MKTLARQRDHTEILERLTGVRPECARRWGRMSVHQMVCHLNDSFRVMTGERIASPAVGPLQRTLVKMDRPLRPLAMAGWDSDTTGNRPGAGGHGSGRL